MAVVEGGGGERERCFTEYLNLIAAIIMREK